MATIFKCFKHAFETDEITNWKDHIAREAHTVRGKSLCNNCERPVTILFNGKQLGKVPALCKDCAKEILEGAQNALIEDDDE